MPNLAKYLSAADAAKLPAWLGTLPPSNNGMVCRFGGVVPSPTIHGYRNKCSFSIGLDTMGVPCVGSRGSSYALGCTVTAPEGGASLPPAALLVARAATAFVRESPLAPYDLTLHTGTWRGLTVRYAESTQQCMVILMGKRPAAVAAAADASSAVSAAASTVAADAAAPHPLPSTSPASSALTAAYAARNLTPSEVYDAELQRFLSLMTSGSLQAFELMGAAPSAAASSAAAQCSHLTSVTSVYEQEYSGVSSPPPNHPFTLLGGAAVIVDHLCGLTFEVSPGAFFQVNTGAADKLYSLVRALVVHGEAGMEGVGGATTGALASAADADGCDVLDDGAAHTIPDSAAGAAGVTVLDVCCGTGTIGLVCASQVGSVIGLELAADAVADAGRNAARNGIANASFVCGDMKDSIRDVVAGAVARAAASTGGGGRGGDGAAALAVTAASSVATPAAATTAAGRVVAVVDPPRGGLHPDVIRSLRTCKALKRIVYVSCNPTGSLVEDLVKLCAPPEDNHKVLRGPPFHPVCSVSVDLFPHTPHCELVVLLERE